ncbi:DUF262 domain-containing protein [Pseudomonas syringae pv. atrofaciens]
MGETHGNPSSRVVDGQQRLTTLTLLFSVIRDLTEGTEKQAHREQYIKQVANEDEGIPEALRLQLRQKDQVFLRSIFRRAERLTTCHRWMASQMQKHE